MLMGGSERGLKLRVSSCLQVINDIHQRLRQEEVHPRIVEQLSKLNELLELLTQRAVTESDMVRIEGCCNQLLGDLEKLFASQKLGALHEGILH